MRASVLLLRIAVAIACLVAPVPLSAESPARNSPSRTTTMVAAVPVVDVRATPTQAAANRAHDAAQETQLLYGERVRVVERAGGWARIEAQEQAEFTHHQRWEGYPGWVPLAALAGDPGLPASLVVQAKWAAIRRVPEPQAPVVLTVALGTWLAGTGPVNGWWRVQLVNGDVGWLAQEQAAWLDTLRAQSAAQRRARLVATARLFLDDPYRWGGRSPHREEPHGAVTGVDCSGLVELAYRSIGLSIPRDAHEQYLRSRRIRRDQLQPGDLIFLSKPQQPEQIVHVLLYAGEGRLIEGPGTGLRVREVAWPERCGLPFNRTEAGQSVNGQTIDFGAYLP